MPKIEALCRASDWCYHLGLSV